MKIGRILQVVGLAWILLWAAWIVTMIHITWPGDFWGGGWSVAGWATGQAMKHWLPGLILIGIGTLIRRK